MKWADFPKCTVASSSCVLCRWQKTNRCRDHRSGWVVNFHRQCFIYHLLIFLHANTGSLLNILLCAEVWRFQQWPRGTITDIPRLAKGWPTCTWCLTFLSPLALGTDCSVVCWGSDYCFLQSYTGCCGVCWTQPFCVKIVVAFMVQIQIYLLCKAA